MESAIVLKNREYYRNRIKNILPFLQLNEFSILDLGCGEMILLDFIKERNVSYTGIDIYPYRKEAEFILGNLLDPELIPNKKYDVLFLLGILDHLDMDQKHQVLLMYKNIFKKHFIISQKNPFSWINKCIQKDAMVIEIEKYFKDDQIQMIPLLKIPFCSKVFNLSNFKVLVRSFCTEKIYIISRAEV